MDAELFLKQFGHLAQGEGGIKKLRDIILQLAVRGKLVEQNPADEPAEVLLKKIEAEKKRLNIKDRLSNADAKDALLAEIELPYNWAKILLGNVVQIIRGITFPAQAKETIQTTNNIACLRTANVQKEVEWHDLIYVSREFVRNEEQIVQPNDILISLANSRELVGKTAIIKKRPVEATLGGFIGAIRPILIEPDFVNFFLSAPYVRAILIADANQTTNIANISGAKLNVVTIPIPPLAEQKRIVAKVDELMALCDKLEAEQKAQAALKTQAVKSTLHHITDAANPKDFASSFNILTNKFGAWFDDLSTVKNLRATILQLAVQGKLVPQNPTDEPASELLKRIEAEKKRLLKEGKIKKSAVITNGISPDSDPFNLPGGWAWSFLNDITLSISDGDHQAPPQADRGVPFIVISNVRNGTVDTQKASRFVPESYFEGLDRQRKPEKGDILYTVTGSIGIPVTVNTDDKFCFQRHIAIIKPLDNSDRRYLHLYLKSDLALGQATKSATGIAQLTIPLKSLRSLLVPLPPLAEQKCIVAKVDELMKLCDQLESQVTQSQILNTHLMDSLIHRITEAA